MPGKLLYFGPQWDGSTSLQRLRAFQNLSGIRAIGIDCGATLSKQSSLWHRGRWKLRLPVDTLGENQRLINAVVEHRPDIVLVDNSKVIRTGTLRRLREACSSVLVYYSPDDITARHNLSFPLKWSLPFWDIVCTTKTFNVTELLAMGANPFLVGKTFDPALHHPLERADVGVDFERFDVVFVGSYERQRCTSINALADAGMSVVVYGAGQGNWRRSVLADKIELRPSTYGTNYTRAWHTGKVALGFLRKINRDRITARSIEVAAMGRPMVAERTDEHNSHFTDGKDYLGFSTDVELVEQVLRLRDDSELRHEIGLSGRLRCLSDGYSTADRARQMMTKFETLL